MLYRVPYGSEVGPRIGKTEGKGGRQAGGSMRETPGRWLRRTTSKEAREQMKISSDMVPISMCRARRPMSGPPCSEWTSPIYSGGSAIESSLEDMLKPACTTTLERVS